MSNNKQLFADSMAFHSGEAHMMNDCMKYGMTWGCDVNCPVLRRHECELKDADNAELYQEFLKEIED